MFGVDLLLFGHVHAYERTNPVSNYQADPSGCSPTYITIGDDLVPRRQSRLPSALRLL